MNPAGIESTIRSYSITGNPYADSLILTQLISVVFAFSSTMTRVFKQVFMYLVKHITSYAQRRLMAGSSDAELVFYTEIKKSDALFYHFIMDTIMKNEDIKSDKNSTQFLDVIQWQESDRNRWCRFYRFPHLRRTSSALCGSPLSG